MQQLQWQQLQFQQMQQLKWPTPLARASVADDKEERENQLQSAAHFAHHHCGGNVQEALETGRFPLVTCKMLADAQRNRGQQANGYLNRTANSFLLPEEMHTILNSFTAAGWQTSGGDDPSRKFITGKVRHVLRARAGGLTARERAFLDKDDSYLLAKATCQAYVGRLRAIPDSAPLIQVPRAPNPHWRPSLSCPHRMPSSNALFHRPLPPHASTDGFVPSTFTCAEGLDLRTSAFLALHTTALHAAALHAAAAAALHSTLHTATVRAAAVRAAAVRAAAVHAAAVHAAAVHAAIG